MNKKILLHCGMPKTGSSALQVQLAQSRGLLLDHGLDYLPMDDFQAAAAGQITSGNGIMLARAYLNPTHAASLSDQRRELTQRFRKAISETPHSVILSSEFFSPIPRPALAELAADLSDLGDVQLVFFVREQLNALASSYIQQVKRHGLTQFPDEYFASWSIEQAPMMNYNAYFDRLRSVAPNVETTVRPYELSRQHKGGIMGLFLEMIGAPDVPVSALPKDSRINLSPDAREIRLMIEANYHGPRMQFSDMLVESSQRAGRSRIHAQHAIIPPEIAEKIRSEFAPGNAAFFQNHVGSENIYTNASRPTDYVDLRNLQFDATSVVEILSALLVNIDRRLARLES